MAIDPTIIVKLDGSRLELGLGGELMAEGVDGQEIVFTSLLDDRYGTGGTFNTSSNENIADAGDWGGVFAGHFSRLSMDHTVMAYGGGVTRVEGNFNAFNTLEIHQAEARVAHTLFEFNGDGLGAQGPVTRFGRGFNEASVIFVRGAQPVIMGNTIRDNEAPAMSINVNALNSDLRRDTGRQSGEIDRLEGYRDNQGPLILDNRIGNNDINGIVVRGQTVTTESVWDDTDIVHVVLDDMIYVSDFHTFTGLRLESSPTESLVVKFFDSDTTDTNLVGLTALGLPHEVDDRIGGIIQVIGQPGSPVVLTSLNDDSEGAGFRPDGDGQNDTNNDGIARVNQLAAVPSPGDWNGIRFDQFTHDRNVETVIENEPRDVNSPGSNAIPRDAQNLGLLAPSEYAGDENRRLGFQIHGFLNDAQDLDIYSFRADTGTEIWLDIDRSTHALDAVIELLDAEGNVIARSDNSYTEQEGTSLLYENADFNEGTPFVFAMNKTEQFAVSDFYATNPRDPGMRVILPGAPNTTLTYHIRVRSGSDNLDDLTGGLTSGAYQLEMRLRELEEVAGSTVRYSSIGYASTGIEVIGGPTHSPLTGEATEDGNANNAGGPNGNAQDIGNLLQSDRGALSVAGVLSAAGDVDVYEMTVQREDGGELGGLPSFGAIFDLDYADGLGRPNATISVFNAAGQLLWTSRDSNIADDRPRPLYGADMTDLSRGTVGASDAFIGPVGLSANATFYVAVSSDAQMPIQLSQFYSANPGNEALFRLEPVRTVRRIVEDHFEVEPRATVDPPQVSSILDGFSPVPYNLGDVVLFVTQSRSCDSFNLRTVDPFTGDLETFVGIGTSAAIGDVVMHPNGNLYAYRLGDESCSADWPNDRESGNFVEINPANGAAQILRDDTIITYELDIPNAPSSIRTHPVGGTLVGDGIQFDAITIDNSISALGGFAVGRRGWRPGTVPTPAIPDGVEYFTNILYTFDANFQSATFGQASSAPAADRVDDPNIPEFRWEGAGTDIRERGELLTAPRITAPNATQGNGAPNISDGTTFTVINGGAATTFEFDFGLEVRMTGINPATGQSIQDGNFFFVDDHLLQLDTGSVIDFVLPPGTSLVPGTIVTIRNSNGVSTNFQFDTLAANVQAPNIHVPIPAGAGNLSASLAANLQTAITTANIGVTASTGQNSS
ncbi:MAG: hypothetical protein KDA47_06965, partial [Planctomycetales bacterium]|nr:hypothetical protein [Planctomycetales bacterium]